MTETDTTAISPQLRRLAEAHGVATEFEDHYGRHREPPSATVQAVLAALGVAAGTEEEVEESLTAAELAEWREVLPPCVVVRQGRAGEVPVHAPAGAGVLISVELEGGGERAVEVREGRAAPQDVDGVSVQRLIADLPDDLPMGWHRLTALVEDEAEPRQTRVELAVVPDRLPAPALATGRGWGAMAQLYSVRSHASWGLGDLADLTELTGIFGDLGADFLLVNPLHAAEPTTPMTPSPYLPATRRFVNPLYIRPEDIREAAYLSGPQRALVDWAAEEVRSLNTTTSPLDRDAVWEAKREALGVLHSAPRSPGRERSLRRFRAEQGQGLEDFALWCALREKHAGKPWPEELRDIRSAQVVRARRELADRVDFYVWLQWIADEQLATAQREARAAGMGLGVIHDLAVGVHPEGAETWAHPEAFARGIAVGAPPDMYNQQGQSWSQPPWRPDTLARTAYAPLRDMLRTVLRHAGAVRIDHIMGLFRLWWIPDGAYPSEGTYVRYDHEAMVGIVLLEAARAGASVIGEDLGTVEPWVREHLAERGVLGTSVLWFEKDDEGRPRRPTEYREAALATVGTHDLPPAAGYLAEEHVDLRRRLGVLTRPVEEVRAEARQERERLLKRLRKEGVLPEDPTERELIEALHVFIARSPAVLVGVALADAVGERRAQNQPGTDTEYPNWRLPLADGAEQAVLIEDLASAPRLRSLVRAVRDGLGPHDRLR